MTAKIKDVGFGIASIKGKHYSLIGDYLHGDGKTEQYLDGDISYYEFYTSAIGEDGNLYRIRLWFDMTDLDDDEAEALVTDPSILIDDWLSDGNSYYLEADELEHVDYIDNTRLANDAERKLWHQVIEE